MKRGLLLALLGPISLLAVEVLDGAGKAVRVNDTGRIVAIGAGAAEIVCALGAEKRLVGVGDSTFPPSLTKLPQVSARHSVSAEGVLALSPTVVLASMEVKPATALDQIRQAGVPVVGLPAETDPAVLERKVRLIAKMLAEEARGEQVLAKVRGQLAAVKAKTEGVPKKRVLFLMSSRGAPFAAGTGTPIDAMIRLAGGLNAITSFADFKPLTPEAAAGIDADLILVPIGGHGFADPNEVLKNPGLAMMRAAKNRSVAGMDLLYLVGYGPRMGSAVQDLAHYLYPDRVTLSGDAPVH